MNRPLILVVEDERLIALDIAMQLRGLGYTAPDHATTTEQAIEMAGQLRPQLVLMDVHLASAMDGVTAAQVIRIRCGLPTVGLSAFGGADSQEQPSWLSLRVSLPSRLRSVSCATCWRLRSEWAEIGLLEIRYELQRGGDLECGALRPSGEPHWLITHCRPQSQTSPAAHPNPAALPLAAHASHAS